MTEPDTPPPSSLSLPPPPDTVLVVDDDAATRLLTSRWLSRAGMRIVEAEDGQQALDAVRGSPASISVIVLDVMMPVMDGYEVLARLSSDPETSGIPVVLLTAHANDEEDVIRGIQHGAYDHLAKPYRGPVLVARVKALIEKRHREFNVNMRLRRAEQQATTDPLTGLSNRRDFERALSRETAFAERHREPLSLLLIDIDHFKSVNDLFGHAEGDRVLMLVSDCIQATLRRSDHAYRLGGEEFAVLLRGTDASAALAAGRRIQEALRSQPAVFGTGDERVITFSGSVAAADLDTDFVTRELVERADQALYAAKRGGRDRILQEELSNVSSRK
ncbi:MAG: diguanylate cyclase [Polyangiaceae bacterium]